MLSTTEEYWLAKVSSLLGHSTYEGQSGLTQNEMWEIVICNTKMLKSR